MKQGPLVLGRSSTSDLRLQHPSISRRHAQLVRKGEHFTICDLGSQNGTFINRKRISGEVELHIGDEIALGNALLKLRGGNGASPVAEPPAPEPKPRIDSPKPMPRRRTSPGMSMGRVAIIAAVAGSAVAALLTLVLLKVMDPGETVTVVEPEQIATAGTAPEADDAQQADPSAPASANKRASKRVRGAVAKEPSAQAVALQAKGSRRQEPGIRTVKGTGEADGDADESDVLSRYEAGDVTEALTLARKARLEPLATRIAAFAAAETAGQKALAENDTAGAMKHLASAFLLDEQLSHGWSAQGRELRKQLGNLHTAQGVQQQRAGDVKAARESFETALKYDSANAQAKAHLAELTASAPPAK